MGQSERVPNLYEEPTVLLVGTNRLSDRLYETLQTKGMDVERVSAAVAPAAYRAVVPDLCVIAADGLDERGKQAVVDFFEVRSRSIHPPVLIETNSQGLTSKLKSRVAATLSSKQPMIALAKQIRDLAFKASQTHDQPVVQPPPPPGFPVKSHTIQSLDSVVSTLELEEDTLIFDVSSRERRPLSEGSRPLEYQTFEQWQSDGNLDTPQSIESEEPEPDDLDLELFEQPQSDERRDTPKSKERQELEPDDLELFESRVRIIGFRSYLTSLLTLIAIGFNRLRSVLKISTFDKNKILNASASRRFVTLARSFQHGAREGYYGLTNRARAYLRGSQGARQNAFLLIKELPNRVNGRFASPLGARLSRFVGSSTLRFKSLSRSNKLLIYGITASIAVGTCAIVIAVDSSDAPADPARQEQLDQTVVAPSLVERGAEAVPSHEKTGASIRKEDGPKRPATAKTGGAKARKESTVIEPEGRSQVRSKASVVRKSANGPAVRRRSITSGRGSKSEGRVTRIAKANQFIRKGNRMLRANRLGIAESYYLKALRAKPRNPRALASLVKVHLQRKDGREALRWAKRLIKKQPKKPANLRLLRRARAMNKIEISKRKKKRALSVSRQRKARPSRPASKKASR